MKITRPFTALGAALGAFVLMLAMFTSTTTAAQADTSTRGTVAAQADAKPALGKTAQRRGSFNDLYHAVNDSGYVAPIRIVCGDGAVVWLKVGQASPPFCGSHVRIVKPQADQMVTCYNTLPPYQRLTYWEGNTRELPSWSSLRCYMGRPI